MDWPASTKDAGREAGMFVCFFPRELHAHAICGLLEIEKVSCHGGRPTPGSAAAAASQWKLQSRGFVRATSTEQEDLISLGSSSINISSSVHGSHLQQRHLVSHYANWARPDNASSESVAVEPAPVYHDECGLPSSGEHTSLSLHQLPCNAAKSGISPARRGRASRLAA